MNIYIKLLLPILITSLLVGCWPNPTTYYFFSELEGNVYLNGKPLKNTEITRYYRSGWFKNPTEETAITNESGYFEFEKAKRFIIIEFLHQPVVNQNIKTKINNKEYELYTNNKFNYENLGEFRYKDKSHKKIKGEVSTEITVGADKLTMVINITENKSN